MQTRFATSLGLLSSIAAPILLMACSTVTQGSPGGTGGHAATGGSGGSGGGGGPVSCTWTVETSNATCPAGPCPIALDESLTCDGDDLASQPIRVAPAPDATWIATTASDKSIVYRLASGAAERQQGVTEAFGYGPLALALGHDGTVYLGGDTSVTTQGPNGPSYTGGATFATYANGAWTSSTIVQNTEGWAPVAELDVGKDDVPRMWLSSTGPTGYSIATLSTPVTIADAPVAIQPGENGISGSGTRFTLASDGSPVSVAYRVTFDGAQFNSQLVGLVGGALRNIGAPVLQYEGIGFALTAAPAPASPAGPLFAVAIDSEIDGVHVLGEPAAGPEIDIPIAGTSHPALTCAPTLDLNMCSGTCHETSSGTEEGAFAIAWTDDGTGWLVHVTTHYDEIVSRSIDPHGVVCENKVIQDNTTATLHLIRVAFDGSMPTEVLTMPIDRPGTRGTGYGWEINARGFGKDLAIGVRTGVAPANAVRLIRVDTTHL